MSPSIPSDLMSATESIFTMLCVSFARSISTTTFPSARLWQLNVFDGAFANAAYAHIGAFIQSRYIVEIGSDLITGAEQRFPAADEKHGGRENWPA